MRDQSDESEILAQCRAAGRAEAERIADLRVAEHRAAESAFMDLAASIRASVARDLSEESAR